jgi:hypothetical protein
LDASIVTSRFPTLIIAFNAGFNAFIGGRGSGKSAVLEYLRFGLARTEKDLGRGPAAGREREEELIEQTLQGGYVEVIWKEKAFKRYGRATYIPMPLQSPKQMEGGSHSLWRMRGARVVKKLEQPEEPVVHRAEADPSA